MTIGAIIQARLDSSRLCHKVLREVAGGTVLGCVLDAARRASEIDEIWLTTPDLALWEYARHIWGIEAQWWRGARDCVEEYHQIAYGRSFDLVIRLTGDCPMVTSTIIDEAVRAFTGLRCDYLYNGMDGADVEVFTWDALNRAWRYAVGDEREHVGLWMRRNLIWHELARRPGPWKSLDTAEDLAYIRHWFEQQGHGERERHAEDMNHDPALSRSP